MPLATDKLRQPPPPSPVTAGIEDQSISTASEALPVPMFCGTRKISPVWITRIYNQKAKEAPDSKPGKK